MIYKNILIFILGTSLCGCSYYPIKGSSNNTFEPIIVKQMDNNYNNTNLYESLLVVDVLYISEVLDNGLSKTNLTTGELLWRNSEVDPSTNPALWEGFIVSLVYTVYEEEQDYNLYFTDQNTGEIIYKFRFKDMMDNPEVGLNGYWSVIHNNKLYFSTCDTSNSFSDEAIKLSMVDISELDFTNSEPDAIVPEVILQGSRLDSLFRTQPLFNVDGMYILSGGAGSSIPEDQEVTETSDYHQSDIKLYALDNEYNKLWERGFEYAGWVGANAYHLQFYDEDYLYLATSDGAALIDKNTGTIIYERVGNYSSNYTTIDGEYGYSTIYGFLKCVHIPTGDIIWNDEIKYTRDCKPVVYGNKLYVVDSDALRVYNKKTGQLLGKNEDLGVPGYRWQGYMPYNNDILHILQTEKIVSIRMED
ncbi:hypothetical protein EW093_02080 [Thiospirochaeta perfilievii]|uniref:PQQ-like beta-propeller repeat protein n=1 Tax=Thiospirochaeta perfilievii TaxID=252967 RepID=A0A5C1Q9R8_9SPIO|nr:hypothetical protein [Thiospirochaeta perfilievii]QEN03536.1 hypothetical protein EW093_02080 [Thiospirochaeta perfilievii]